MFLAEIPTQLETVAIPEGSAGTRRTLKIMAALAKQARKDEIIRDTAKNLVMTCGAGDYRGEVNECFVFVRDHIRYLMDTVGMERVAYPVETLRARAGDCDDKSTLLAALLESIGHPCRFVAVGYTHPGDFEHVYVETRIGKDWVPCETTLNVDLGWAPVPPFIADAITAKMIEHI